MIEAGRCGASADFSNSDCVKLKRETRLRSRRGRTNLSRRTAVSGPSRDASSIFARNRRQPCAARGATTEIRRDDAGRCHPFYVGGIEDATLTSATRTLLFKIDHFA
jgi:hypothetical protein